MAKMGKIGKATLGSAMFLMLLVALVVVVFYGGSDEGGTSFGLIADLQTNYIDTGISDAIPDNSSYVSDFNIVADLNTTIFPLAKKLETEEDTETSLIGDLFRGGMFLVTAIFYLPGMMFDVLRLGTTMLTTLMNDVLGVPQPVIFIAVVAGLIWVSFKLVSYARRSET